MSEQSDEGYEARAREVDSLSWKLCRLCKESADFRNSHIHPKFYWAWRKATAAGRYFRDAAQPNRRLQDGPTFKMLCGACEGLFSRDETAFARIFRSLMKDPGSTVTYDDSGFRCLLSVLWRSLALEIDLGRGAAFKDQLSAIDDDWRDYLLRHSQAPKYDRVHIWVTDLAASDSLQFNTYLTREADATTMWTDSAGLLGFYTKFGKICLFAECAAVDPKLWINTLLCSTGGTLRPSEIRILDGRFGDFIRDRALMWEDAKQSARRRMSKTQKEHISREARANPAFIESELARAMLQDSAWQLSLPKVGRNEDCPCGSRRKYERCHGA